MSVPYLISWEVDGEISKVCYCHVHTLEECLFRTARELSGWKQVRAHVRRCGEYLAEFVTDIYGNVFVERREDDGFCRYQWTSGETWRPLFVEWVVCMD